MKKLSAALASGIILMGVLFIGCEKHEEPQPAGQTQTEQTPTTEKAPAKKAPVGC